MNLKGKSTLERLTNIMRVKNYSENTISTYIHHASEFLSNFNDDIYHINQKRAIEFLCLNKYSSIPSQNQYISSVKLLYKYIVGSILHDFKIERPRKETHLPDILSQEEIAIIINSIKNKKHRAIISTIYYFGLRISECTKVRVSDFNKYRKQLHVRQSKGAKDRNIPTQDKWIPIISEYYKEYKPTNLLFEGQNGFYSNSSIRNILKAALKRCGINKNIHVHSLRHAYACHLLENGIDIYKIKEWLGHRNIKTTERYLQMTNKCYETSIL